MAENEAYLSHDSVAAQSLHSVHRYFILEQPDARNIGIVATDRRQLLVVSVSSSAFEADIVRNGHRECVWLRNTYSYGSIFGVLRCSCRSKKYQFRTENYFFLARLVAVSFENGSAAEGRAAFLAFVRTDETRKFGGPPQEFHPYFSYFHYTSDLVQMIAVIIDGGVCYCFRAMIMRTIQLATNSHRRTDVAKLSQSCTARLWFESSKHDRALLPSAYRASLARSTLPNTPRAKTLSLLQHYSKDRLRRSDCSIPVWPLQNMTL